ncbi:MAG: ABC transporter permease [Pseudomonadota bacterium]|nr:ABC transporter permease [Pseudomonadota bacterium]
MRVFFAAAYYSYRGIFAWLTPAMYVAQKLMIPLFQVGFFSLIGAFGGAQPLDFYLLGNAMVIAGAGGVWIAIAVNEERVLGTLVYALASPANRVALFYGRAAVHVVDAFFHVLLAFAWAMLVFGLDLPFSTWGGILLAIVVGTIATAGLGLLAGALAYVVLDAFLLANMVTFLLLLLSGANIPLSELPSWLALLGQALPLSRSIEAARILAAGDELMAALPLLIADLAVGFVYAGAGFFVFRWVEVLARRRGSFEDV